MYCPTNLLTPSQRRQCWETQEGQEKHPSPDLLLELLDLSGSEVRVTLYISEKEANKLLNVLQHMILARNVHTYHADFLQAQNWQNTQVESATYFLLKLL